MPKSKRFSIPVSREIEKQLRALSAENGRSISAILAEMASAGIYKNGFDEQIAALKSCIKNQPAESPKGSETLSEIRQILSDFRTEIRAEIAQKPPNSVPENQQQGVVLPEKAALLLFEEALFSSALSAEIIASDIPGAPRQPGGFYVSKARQKAKATVQNFLVLCQESS